MKTKIFITTLCLISAAFVFGQNKQPGKADITAMEVESKIRSNSYEIKVNRVNPMSGKSRYLTSDYSVRISGDSAYVYLPYFGRAYSTPMNGDGGIKTSTAMDNYKVDYKKGKSWSINFRAKGADDTYRFSISVWTSGKASVNVTCNNRQPISYWGDLVLQ